MYQKQLNSWFLYISSTFLLAFKASLLLFGVLWIHWALNAPQIFPKDDGRRFRLVWLAKQVRIRWPKRFLIRVQSESYLTLLLRSQKSPIFWYCVRA